MEGFPFFSLPAWEFPEAAEMRVRVALGDEQLAVAENQRRRHINDVFGLRAYLPTLL